MSDVIKITDIPRKFYSISHYQLQYWLHKNIRNINKIIFEIDGIKYCRTDDLRKWYEDNRRNKTQRKYDIKRDLASHTNLVGIPYVEYIQDALDRIDVNNLITKIKNGEMLRVEDGW